MKKYLLLFIFTILCSLHGIAQDFITRWDLSQVGSSDTSITFNVATIGTVNYTWETIPIGTTGSGSFSGTSATINGLPAGATIRLKINPTNFQRITISNGSDRQRLKDVEQWGAVAWTSMSQAFEGCSQLNISAIDIPNLSVVTDMSRMFRVCSILNSPLNINSWNVSNVIFMQYMFDQATSFNQPISNWNTSNVINMSSMFQGTFFNQPIGNWNTSNVTDMSSMFFFTYAFNQPLANWNVSNVTNMSAMFRQSYFNQPIGNWNVSNVTNMSSMFQATVFNQPIGNWNTGNVNKMSDMFTFAYSFNQPIGNWNVSNVTNMWNMFQDAYAFNQPIGNWNTVNVLYMNHMFYHASAFNQPIGNWNTANVTSMWNMFVGATAFNQSLGNWSLNPAINLSNMLDNSGLDCLNYSATLQGWAANAACPSGRNLGAVGMHYGTNAQMVRNYLINTKGWSINGDAMSSGACCAPQPPTVINQTACGSYTFNGQNLSTSGVYHDTLSNQYGCDSLIDLNLTITPAPICQHGGTVNTAVCGCNCPTGFYGTHCEFAICNTTYGSSTVTSCTNYIWNNTTYTASGTYIATLTNSGGCDSIHTLFLTINAPTSSSMSATACDSYTWSDNGTVYTQSGTYTNTTTNAAGCTDVATLNLTINASTASSMSAIACDSYTWAANGTAYTQSGVYTNTTTNAAGCPNTEKLILTINPLPIVVASNATGCPGVAIALIGTPIGGTFSLANPYLGPASSYTYTYTNSNGCTATSSSATVSSAILTPPTINPIVVTTTSAVVSWVAVSGFGWFGVRYRAIGTSSWTSGTINANTKNIPGLTPCTNYEVQVQTLCAGGSGGAWSASTSFLTVCSPCSNPPAVINTPIVTGHTAKITWTTVPGAAWYGTRYRTTNPLGTWVSGTTIIPSRNYTGLPNNKCYEFQVQSVCNGGGASAWSTAVYYCTTNAATKENGLTAEENNNFNVYPNPATDVLNIELGVNQSQTTTIKIFDMSGHLVKEVASKTESGIQRIEISLLEFANGLYTIHIYEDDALTHVSKVQVQHQD